MPRDPITELEGLKQLANELQERQAEQQQEIKAGFKDTTVVFMDVVDSTQFKQDHADEPWVWITRVRQFSNLLAQAVEDTGGVVVKYIGDEVMAVYDDPNKASALLMSVGQIEERLSSATGFETRIKVAADYGEAYFLEFDGHEPPDPQGPVVDRCARIAKHAEAGQVITSNHLKQQTPALRWKRVGKVKLKGLGEETIYQLNRNTVQLTEMTLVSVKRLTEMQETLEVLQSRVEEVEAMNASLVSQMAEKNMEVDPDDVAEQDNGDALERFDDLLRKIKELIDSNPGGQPGAYACFLYLRRKRGEGYPTSSDLQFDGLIRAGLVEEAGHNYYELASGHRLTDKVTELINEADDILQYDLPAAGDDELYERSFTDPTFWKEELGYDVI